jgi:hypothetical protein
MCCSSDSQIADPSLPTRSTVFPWGGVFGVERVVQGGILGGKGCAGPGDASVERSENPVSALDRL